MTWLWIALAFLTGLSVCYWKRAFIMTLLPNWHRPSKEPVDNIAARLDSAADRLEAVTAELAQTVGAMKNGAPARDQRPPSRFGAA